MEGNAPVKITITVDCTPEEARGFLGLPDLTAMHEQFRQHMSQDPEAAMKAWLTGATELQGKFWQQMMKPPNPKAE